LIYEPILVKFVAQVSYD